jgi:hypothetical protein
MISPCAFVFLPGAVSKISLETGSVIYVYQITTTVKIKMQNSSIFFRLLFPLAENLQSIHT